MSDSNLDEPTIYDMPDVQIKPDDFHEYRDQFSGSPIIIDNGSWECRAGFECFNKPKLVFKNLIVRNRGKKDFETQVGNDIKNIELFRWLLKNQFDRNVVTNFENQETILDYIFSHLGITKSSVDHPIVMTEAFSNPNFSRQCNKNLLEIMSELLFEAYQVPSVAYGVDCLFSLYKNYDQKPPASSLIISCGYNTTHIIPILNNRIDLPKSQRINIGGCQMVSYLHRLLQLKYPTHFASVTLSRAEELFKQHMMFAEYYQDDLNNLNNQEFYSKRVHKIQLPYIPLPGSVSNKPYGKTERCEAMIDRLKDIHMKKRSLNLTAKEEKLQQLNMIQELYEERDLDLFQRALREFGFSSLVDLQNGKDKLSKHIQRAKGSSCVNYDTLDGVELEKFPDIETWILAVRKKWQKFRELSLEELNQPRKHFKTEDLQFSIENELDIDILSTEWDEFEGPVKLQELEDILNEYEGEFNKEHAIGCESSLSFNLAEYYQLHLGVERTRVSEIIFQPSMIGVEQAGIAEVVDNLLKTYSIEEQKLLFNNVFLTGGFSRLPGLITRMNAELQQMLPFQSVFKVTKAADSVLDSWNGARVWSLNEGHRKYFLTKQEYEEKGGDYLKESTISNVYIPSPQIVKPVV